MAEMFYDDDADLAIIQGRKVAVIGYGSQGHAHALNLRDSGVDVRVGLAEGSKSRAKAEAEGLRVLSVAEAVAEADLVVILTPDQVQRTVYANEIQPNLAEGAALLFGHGFNIRFGYITPEAGSDVSWSPPRAPATSCAASSSTAAVCPCCSRSSRTPPGHAWDLAKSYAKAIGGLRAGGIKTTFTEECETDLFGEQAVLCGGASQLVMYGFETLVEAGYQPEVAYFECLHELKLIVDLMIEGGIAKQRWSVSDTAEYGDYVSGPRVIDPSVKENMQAVLADIRNGAFAKRFIDDQDAGARSSRSCAPRVPLTRSRPPAASCASSWRGSALRRPPGAPHRPPGRGVGPALRGPGRGAGLPHRRGADGDQRVGWHAPDAAATLPAGSHRGRPALGHRVHDRRVHGARRVVRRPGVVVGPRGGRRGGGDRRRVAPTRAGTCGLRRGLSRRISRIVGARFCGR
jgi:ketol-acid reductoisomerase